MQNGILYISTQNCSVCHVLKPKLKSAIAHHYPKLQWQEVIADQDVEFAAQHAVFSVPTVLFFLDGKEQARFVRAFSVNEVLAAVERPYEMMFGE